MKRLRGNLSLLAPLWARHPRSGRRAIFGQWRIPPAPMMRVSRPYAMASASGSGHDAVLSHRSSISRT